MKKHILELSVFGYLILLCPVLAFPAAFLPYSLWGITPFASLVRIVLEGERGNAFWLAFHAQETIIFFWLALSVLVLLACIVLAVLRVRPWYFIPVYLLVMASLCGIFALVFYSIMAR